MRKNQKKELLELIKELRKIHEALYIVSDEHQRVMELLTVGQNTAITIGNSIEETEGQGTQVVTLLEEYCEILYQASLEMSEKNVEALDDKLQLIAREIEKIPTKLEVVFFPYKYSMWDSFESVWKAACKEHDCDVYVVPIPYFDRNNDGSFGEVHYEGSMFPESVGVFPFTKYNVSERHPDIVFIHNPYDENNLVTSVHPDYYAKKLKDETDMLVYIPYDMCVNDVVSEHLVVTSGTLFSHKVVLQSEKVRNQYIEIYKKLFREMNREDLIIGLEDKYVALGSPKVDKVLGDVYEDIVLPETWKMKIGSGCKRKKVILYNTHLNNLMPASSEQFLKKLRYTFDVFGKRKDVVLLWRPHPLSIATAKSMNPAILPEYNEFVNVARSAAWCIYDDTPEMERAIIISDAYYGDGGSLLELYKHTGKPVLQQIIDIN